MQLRDLTKSQYLYFKEVLGVDTVFATQQVTAKTEPRVVLLSAPLSNEEKDLLAKIMQAFGWQDYKTIIASTTNETKAISQLFLFGEEAKRFADQHLKYQEAILAPSLGVLLSDSQAKKTLWQQMKRFMESK